MTDKPDTDVQPTTPEPAKGPPKQALSGGGFEHAGSDEGGSAYGDDREDAPEPEATEPQAPEGGFKADTATEATPDQPSEEKTFASPDGQEDAREASTESVNNTGEPRPVKNREGVEGQPGDDVDAASG